MDDIRPGSVVWRRFETPGGRVLIEFDDSIDKPINGHMWTSFQGDLTLHDWCSGRDEEQRIRAFLVVADRVAISEPIRDQAITLRRLHRLKIPSA